MEGVQISKVMPSANLNGFLQRIRKMAEPYGLQFNEMLKLPNSRMSLEAGEFARDNGKFDQFHEQVFLSYFTNGLDIGKMDTILDIAHNVGIDHNKLKKALLDEIYLPRLSQARQDSLKYGVTAAPTFILGDNQDLIVGAQPIEMFREILKRY